MGLSVMGIIHEGEGGGVVEGGGGLYVEIHSILLPKLLKKKN